MIDGSDGSNWYGNDDDNEEEGDNNSDNSDSNKSRIEVVWQR